MLYAKEALNTITASRWTLLLARLFGHKTTTMEGTLRMRLARWRGVTYLIDYVEVEYV